MIRFKEYLERRARRAAFMSVCLAGLTGFGGFFLGSCANEDLGKNLGEEGDRNAAVAFNVSEAQDDAQTAAKAMPGVPVTRAAFSEQLGMMNLTPADLTTQKLAVQGAAGADLCLIETTTPGIFNPTGTANAAEGTEAPDNGSTDGPATRANVTTLATLGNFTTIGYRGTSATDIGQLPWFHDKDTRPDGTLVSPIYWWIIRPYAKFFAIAPREAASYAKLKISPDTYAGTPYVDFEVEPNVKNQKDLMTACSGLVHYDTPDVAPRTDLKFRHALTAVRFKVGQNLSYNKRISKIEIIGARNKGRYVLPTDGNSTGTWSSLDASTATFTLGGDGTVNVSTSQSPNQLITGINNDNYTFYMIPQELTGVKVKVYFSDNSTPIEADLSGRWKPGTTKTYALSQKNSSWEYQLTITPIPNAAEYTDTQTGNYGIQSYRETSGTRQPVKWKVVGYQESADGGATFGPETTAKPAWLTALTAEEGDGSAWSPETGKATIQAAPIIDKMESYNKVLREATAKTGPDGYYDLSMHDFKGNPTAKRNTANSYLISAPGHYKIPLVYGNAITDGKDNKHAYIRQAPGTLYEHLFLRNFKDHNNADIHSPYINVQNAADPATQAAIVWTDQAGIVDGLSVTNNGQDSYLNFHVPANKIRNGNAVVAVKNASGTIMWSWHLWFDHDDVLETVKCTNFQGFDYYFTKQTLGFTYRKWDATTYDKPRVARVKVEQTVANNGTKRFAYIDITQNPNNVKRISATYYQFGRKDAMPDAGTVSDGSYTGNGGNNMSIQNGIQHPGTFYTNGNRWSGVPPTGYTYLNLWSMDLTQMGHNDNTVVKTIYDPCPAGFKMPASNAFTFCLTDENIPTSVNTNGAWDYGWNFNNKITSPDATVYFPAFGMLDYLNGSVYTGPGMYWTAVSYRTNTGCCMSFSLMNAVPKFYFFRAYGYSARPVAE
ncbi:fimbrillin family protein [[Hallella] seregens]|uniref:Fimbrillin family protein n=1 Tax=Hallella seregens ATCC 51272 TaxID=1336250 RepID=A0ABV5ZJW1_9BACT|nr:fimbrillin family protein [Hallella seregens]